ncbi:MAG: NADH-quinone oxidoreductase subunit [Acidimicrobiaceae bacterium]|nr:NADH-quinone oxidoreductase subunit [Acidimicrobiaceae bacterium]MDQ1418156.1 NADH-quinone oxidoreductase subunit [Acidimicrobiaceae bacterium]
MDFPILTTLIFLPAAGAAAVAVVPKTREDIAKVIGIAVAVAEAVLAIFMLVDFKVGEAGFQFVSHQDWIPDFGISWHLGVDGISLFLVLLTAVIFPIAMAGPKIHGQPKAFLGWMLLLEAGCIGTFLAMDLFLFFLMFELTLVPMYFLISGWGYANRVYAALKFFIFTLAGSAFLLVGILAVVFLTSSGGHLSFDLIDVARRTSQLTQTEQRLIFMGFIIAFAVKTPLFPLHTWLPDAHTEAPTAGSVILAAVLLKLGTYGILRFGVFLFPKAAVDLGPILLTAAVIGMTYGAIVAAMQKDLKRLIAYSSVAHLGFIVLGIFAFTSQGISGGVLQMVNHGLSTGALFLLVGMIYERRHTRQISELHGLQKSVPIMAAVFLVVMMSSVGLPGLNGFVGEFLVLLGTFITHRWWAVVGSTGVILAAVYLLWAYQRVFHGVPEGENAKMLDMTLREKAMMAPLLLGIVFLGVYPKPVLDRIQPSVDHLIAHVQHADPSLHLPTKGVGPVVAVGRDDNVDGGSTAAVTSGSANAAPAPVPAGGTP